MRTSNIYGARQKRVRRAAAAAAAPQVAANAVEQPVLEPPEGPVLGTLHPTGLNRATRRNYLYRRHQMGLDTANYLDRVVAEHGFSVL